jgi:hypothetical protein
MCIIANNEDKTNLTKVDVIMTTLNLNSVSRQQINMRKKRKEKKYIARTMPHENVENGLTVQIASEISVIHSKQMTQSTGDMDCED